MAMDLQHATLTLGEVRVVDSEDDSGPTIVGYAAVFDQLSDPALGFRESIKPGAFTAALRGKPDVAALINHDPRLVLGRTTAGTLKLNQNDKGLAVEINPPETQYSRDLMASMKRGDISQMSFQFRDVEDFWFMDGKEQRRELRKIGRLIDVSVVTFPAYPQTVAEARSAAGFKAPAIEAEKRSGLSLAKYRLVLQQQD